MGSPKGFSSGSAIVNGYVMCKNAMTATRACYIFDTVKYLFFKTATATKLEFTSRMT